VSVGNVAWRVVASPTGTHGSAHARLTTQRRRSGLSIFPRRCPSRPASPDSTPRLDASASSSPAPVPSADEPDPPQPTVLLAPTVVGLLRDLHFLARLCHRLPVRHCHINRSQQVHYLPAVCFFPRTITRPSCSSFVTPQLVQRRPGRLRVST
jgi:hypothetical protein